MNRSLLSLLVLGVLLCLTAPAAARPVPAAAASSLQGGPTWSLCPGAPTTINITNVTLSLQGRDLALAMEANVQETLEQGSLVTIGVSLNGGQIYSENLDMSVGTNMPVSGDFVWKYGVSIPSIAPSGAYSVALTFSNQYGMPLTCMQVDFNL